MIDQQTANVSGTAGAQEPEAPCLLPQNEAQEFRAKWEKIQTEFVDEPQRSVHDADELVSSATKRLAEIFADERAKLEREWDRGDDVSTEDLRQALRRYRSFFQRLLSL